jgi:outer membrane protein OmpA-like peptidoglycan-associated protein
MAAIYNTACLNIGVVDMFSQDDESTGVALGVVFGVIFLVVSLVIGLAIHQQGKSAKKAQAAAATTAATPAAADDVASVKVENGVVKFYFASAKAEIAADGAKALAEILTLAKTGKKVGISGFVDPSGDPQKNAELAKQRALAVRDLLISSGVPEGDIVMVRPSDINAGATTAAEGRRVEVFMI